MGKEGSNRGFEYFLVFVIMIALLFLWRVNSNLDYIGKQLERQADAANRQASATSKMVDLIKEQNAAIPELQKLMDQLRGSPLPAEAASSPKK